MRQKAAVLIITLGVFTGALTIAKIKDQHQQEIKKPEPIIIIITATPTPTVTPTPMPAESKTVKYYQAYIRGANLDRVQVSAVYMHFEYIGLHYITAYCPEECGYREYADGTNNFPKGWITATGTTCHREEEWYEPSTCGIATDYHRYGELFLIDGKVYVAEDTGLISGPWIDLFMPDYETMASFGSHWTEVYSVEYRETEPKTKKHFDINDYINNPTRQEEKTWLKN